MEYFWIDLISIGLILLTTIICYFRGFFSSLLSVLGFVGSVVVAILFRAEVLALLESLFGLETWLASMLGEGIATYVGMALAVVATFFAIRILVFILNHTVGKLFKGKVLGKTNAVLGSVLGVVQGVCYVGIILVLFNVASFVPQVKDWTEQTFSQTIFVGAVYDFIGNEIGIRGETDENGGEGQNPPENSGEEDEEETNNA